jgi:hypothetical protein
MYGFKTLQSLNNALYSAGLGRFEFTEEEWLFGCDSRKAYTLSYCNVGKVLENHKLEVKARAIAEANRPRICAAHYNW